MLPGENTAQHKPGGRPAGGLFDAEMLAQLEAVFSKMQQPIVLRLFLRDDALSAELRQYMQQLAELTDKLSVQIDEAPQQEQALPCVRVCREGRHRHRPCLSRCARRARVHLFRAGAL